MPNNRLAILAASSLALLIQLHGMQPVSAQSEVTDEESLQHGGYDDSSTTLPADAIPLQQLLQLAESGDSSAQFELGTRYLAGSGLTQDNFAAAEWFRRAAALNNANAQYNLGVMSLNGMGVITDFDAALGWFRKAAENADTTAQFTLGVIYANGRGVPQDLVAAHMWFSLAAAGGEQNAAINAVLFQEMLSAEQLEASQRGAQAWIESFNQSAPAIQ